MQIWECLYQLICLLGDTLTPSKNVILGHMNLQDYQGAFLVPEIAHAIKLFSETNFTLFVSINDWLSAFDLMICLVLKILDKNRHAFVKHGCPRRQQSQNMAKLCISYILIPPHPTPGACDVSEVWGNHRWTYSPSLVTLSSPKL